MPWRIVYCRTSVVHIDALHTDVNLAEIYCPHLLARKSFQGQSLCRTVIDGVDSQA